jgi:cell division protein FtsL
VLSVVGELLRHPLLERLVRGRWSIALIAFALIGIVTLQLGLLQLNAGIGRSLVRERALERQNASLSIENSGLASGERVQQLAARLGMAPASPLALRFLRASYGTGVSAKAALALRTPVHSAEGEAAGAAASEAATQSSASEASAQTPSSEASAQTSSSEASAQTSSTPSAEVGASSEGEAAPAQAAESALSGSGEASSGG